MSNNEENYYTWHARNLILNCRLQPKASEDGFAEISAGRIKIRITAPPIDGKANKHLIRFLARQFKVPQDNVTIMSGDNSRQKRIQITDPQCLPVDLKITFPVTVEHPRR
ncbi:MAG: YggU family protein [Gammaproteobacteria bacterium RIFCSPLOWO2_02_FULL_57_10]|nr:MAG: YggU family protein [Gammaproteobacteria bacterium RIFCSPLOWO2_02_FULL_57_10]